MLAVPSSIHLPQILGAAGAVSAHRESPRCRYALDHGGYAGGSSGGQQHVPMARRRLQKCRRHGRQPELSRRRRPLRSKQAKLGPSDGIANRESRVLFPGALNSEFTNTLKFLTPSTNKAIPTYRVMDQSGRVLDKEVGVDTGEEEALALYKNMVCCT